MVALMLDSSATAWSRRRLTTAGVAPMSLIDTRTPASGWRSWKSRTTACQIGAEAARRGLDVRPCSACRRAARAAPRGCPSRRRRPARARRRRAGCPPENEKSRVSIPAGRRSLLHLLYQFRKRLGGWYSPPDARTRSRMLRAASRLRVASRGSMPRSCGRRITPRSRRFSTARRSRPRPTAV